MAGRIESSDSSKVNLVSHENVLPKIDIRERQAFITSQFSQFYTQQGYRIVEPEGLLPKEDSSVIFTGATITPLKRYLEEGVISPGFCLVQKCLRTKRLDEILDLSIYPDWTHYFTMCGILTSPERLGELSGEAYELLIDKFQIPRNNLLIEASSDDEDLFAYWNSKGIKNIKDTHPKNYYQWQYGLPNISGRGINFLLRFDENDTYRDLGNVVSIEDNNGKVKAYEFGFGLESLLSKMYGFKKPMEVSVISTVIPYETGLKEKFADTLSASIVLFHHGVEPGRGKEKHIQKKLIKGLSFLRRRIGISVDQIKDYGNRFEEVEFMIDGGSGSKLAMAVIDYENQLARFNDYAKNQVHAHKLRSDMSDRLTGKLRREGENMGISPPEIDEIVSAVLS